MTFDAGSTPVVSEGATMGAMAIGDGWWRAARRTLIKGTLAPLASALEDPRFWLRGDETVSETFALIERMSREVQAPRLSHMRTALLSAEEDASVDIDAHRVRVLEEVNDAISEWRRVPSIIWYGHAPGDTWDGGYQRPVDASGDPLVIRMRREECAKLIGRLARIRSRFGVLIAENVAEAVGECGEAADRHDDDLPPKVVKAYQPNRWKRMHDNASSTAAKLSIAAVAFPRDEVLPAEDGGRLDRAVARVAKAFRQAASRTK